MHAAKTHLSRLVEEALAGEDIVIARGGHPAVRLVPLAETVAERVPGSLRGRVRIQHNFDAPLPADVAAAFGSGSGR